MSSILCVGLISFLPSILVFKLVIMFGLLGCVLWMWESNLLEWLKLPMKDMNPRDLVGFYTFLGIFFLLNLSLQMSDFHTFVDLIVGCWVSMMSLYMHLMLRLVIILVFNYNKPRKLCLFQYDFKYILYLGLLRVVVTLVCYLLFMSGAAWALPGGDNPINNRPALKLKVPWDKLEKFNIVHGCAGAVVEGVTYLNDKTSHWRPVAQSTSNGHWMSPVNAFYPTSADMKSRAAFQEEMGKLMREGVTTFFKKS